MTRKAQMTRIGTLSVNSGDVTACKGEGVLRASAIGSCVVVTAYDPDSGVEGSRDGAGGGRSAFRPGLRRMGL